MLVAKKRVIVNAELFQWGMESGVCRYNMFIPKENSITNSGWNSTKYPGYLIRHEQELDTRGFNQQEGDYVPYIAISLTGYVRVKEGDYIITESKANGTVDVRYPISAQQFQDDFEPVIVQEPESELYRFNIHIGDWSEDGHNQSTTYTIESTKTVDEVQDAFISAAIRLKVLTEGNYPRFVISDKYEQYTVPASIVESLDAAGIDIDKVFELSCSSKEEPTYQFINGPKSMATLLMLIAQLDLVFEYKFIENAVPNFNGFWDKKLNVQFGYGLYS